jgi:hypothetical protein
MIRISVSRARLRTFLETTLMPTATRRLPVSTLDLPRSRPSPRFSLPTFGRWSLGPDSLLTKNRMGIVKGDPSYSAPPDAVPQTGIATSGYAQATPAVASGYPAPASSGAVTSAQPAASQAAAAAPSNVASVVPGGGAVLIGESSPGAAYPSASTSAGAPAAVPSSDPANPPVANPPIADPAVANPSVANPPAANPPAASVVVPANGGTAEEMSDGSSVPVPAPAPTQEAIPPKGCGRNGKKGPYRSAM